MNALMEEVENEKGIVQSDQVLLEIIDSLHHLEIAGVTELAKMVGISKSAVHKHLKTLEQLNYVVNDNGTYRLGLKFFTYGAGIKATSELAQLLIPKTKELVEEVDEMVVASLEEHGKGTFIAIKNDRYNLQQASNLGDRYHLNVCASGKAMLAEYPDEKIEEIIDRYGLPQRSPNTITSREELFEDINSIRERNYSQNTEELREGLNAAGSAVKHPETGEIGALAISGPAHRITEESIKNKYSDILLEIINELELQLNYG